MRKAVGLRGLDIKHGFASQGVCLCRFVYLCLLDCGECVHISRYVQQEKFNSVTQLMTFSFGWKHQKNRKKKDKIFPREFFPTTELIEANNCSNH